MSRLLLLLAVAGACAPGTEPSAGADRLVIILATNRASWPVQDTVRATAVGVAEDGTPLPTRTPQWRSLQPAVASVDQTGLVRMLAPGEATIEAELGSATGQLRITVRGMLHNLNYIDRDETWRVADTPHVVLRHMGVGGLGGGRPTTLTIEPGVTVRLRPGAGLHFGDIDPAALIIGAGGDPVVMEGDSAVPGSWVGISFRQTMRSELRSLVLRHCGSLSPTGGKTACLDAAGGPSMDGPELLIDDVTISEARDGLDISHWVTIDPASRNLNIENTTGRMVAISPQVVHTFPRGGRFTGNAEADAFIGNGLIDQSVTWSDIGIPLRLVGEVMVWGVAGTSLTIAPGLTIRSDPGGSITARRLVAGEPGGAPVLLESTGAGWGGIALENGSALYHVTVRDCAADCLSVADTGLLVHDVVIRDAGSAGIRLDNLAKFHAASQNLTIMGSRNEPLNVPARAIPTIPSGDYRSNGIDAIRVRLAQVTGLATWTNLGVPYLVGGDLEVSSGLILAPGVVLQMGLGTQVNVADALLAEGTPGEPIIIGSVTPGVAGSWRGLFLGPGAEASLEYVEINDAGAGPYSIASAVSVQADPGPFLRNSVIRRSAGCGLILSGGLGSPGWTTDYTDPAYGNAFEDLAGPVMCEAPN